MRSPPDASSAPVIRPSLSVRDKASVERRIGTRRCRSE
jgi:hypothetical protein